MRVRVEARGVWTGDPETPWASHAELADGLFAADSGDPSAALPLGDFWVLPGLIDSHLHLLMGGLSLARLDLSGVSTRAEFEAAISERASSLPSGAWLEAFGWDDRRLGGVRPDASWLRMAGNRCAVAWRCDQHVALANERAMAGLDLSAQVPGGVIERAPNGTPTGIFIEQAAWRVLMPSIPAPSSNAKQRALHAAARHLAALGVTSCGAMEYLADLEGTLAPLAHRGTMPLRVFATILDRDRPLPFTRARALPTTATFRTIGFKSFADGTLGSSTAAMKSHFEDSAGSGELVEHAREGTLSAWMAEVLAAGFSPSVHAIGDRALDEVLRAAQSVDHDHRTRFEHAQIVDPASLAHFAGRTLSMQPFHKATDAPLVARRLGVAREDRVFRFREFVRHGAALAFGSDWPISSADPIQGMRTAITGAALDGRTYWTSQNLTPHEAIAAYTTGAAACLSPASHVGRIAPGFHADFVALDRDPLSCDWLDAPPKVVLTAISGRVIYDAIGATTDSTSTTR